MSQLAVISTHSYGDSERVVAPRVIAKVDLPGSAVFTLVGAPR